MERDHVIWSDEHQMFWRHDFMGYTKSFKQAGLYTEEEVRSVAKHCGPEKGVVGFRVEINYCNKLEKENAQ